MKVSELLKLVDPELWITISNDVDKFYFGMTSALKDRDVLKTYDIVKVEIRNNLLTILI